MWILEFVIVKLWILFSQFHTSFSPDIFQDTSFCCRLQCIPRELKPSLGSLINCHYLRRRRVFIFAIPQFKRWDFYNKSLFTLLLMLKCHQCDFLSKQNLFFLRWQFLEKNFFSKWYLSPMVRLRSILNWEILLIVSRLFSYLPFVHFLRVPGNLLSCERFSLRGN